MATCRTAGGFCRSVRVRRDRVKLRSEELPDWYLTTHIMRVRWAGHVACTEVKRNAYRVLVEKPERERTLGRHPRRCEDNIKMDHKYDGSLRARFVRLGTGATDRVLCMR